MPESPVETTGKAGSAVTTSPAEVKVSGTTGAVTVKADNQKEILKQAKEKKSAQVVLAIANSDAKGAEKLELNLEKSFLESLLKDTSAKLVVKTPLGQKTYERDELQKLVNETTGTTVKAEINKDNVDTAAEEPTDENAAKIAKGEVHRKRHEAHSPLRQDGEEEYQSGPQERREDKRFHQGTERPRLHREVPLLPLNEESSRLQVTVTKKPLLTPTQAVRRERNTSTKFRSEFTTKTVSLRRRLR